jgi:hypothetical protein
MKKSSILIAAVLALLLSAANNAHAGLIGSTVNSTYYFPDLSSPFENDGTQVVNPTANFNPFGEVGEVVSDSQIVLTNTAGIELFFSPGAFNGPVFDFTGGQTITGVSLDGASTVTPVSITLSPDGSGGQLVAINMEGLPFPADANVTVDVQTTGAAPEPASLTMLGIGAFGLLGYAWKRRKTAALPVAN